MPESRRRTVESRPVLDPELVWEAAKAQWQVSLQRPSFEAWVRPIRVIELASPTTRLAVPSGLAKSWIEERLRETVEDTLSDMLGAEVTIEVVVDPTLIPATNLVEPVVDTTKIIPLAPAIMEYTLSRRAVWDTHADRGQLELHFSIEDLEGEITIDLSRGRLSTADMELTAWMLGRWERGTPVVSFNAREYARDCGVSWAGWRGKSLRDQLYRIHGAKFVARTWNARSGQREERFFGILDDARLRDKAKAASEPFAVHGNGTITVRLSHFLVEQLEAGQFIPINWRILRGRLHGSLQRRLYVFLEGQKGFGPNGDLQWAIDEQFLASVGIRDDLTNHGSRIRANLTAAGEAILTEDSRYTSIRIRAGKGKRWVFEVRRSPRKRLTQT